MATLPESKPVGAVPVSSLDEVQTGDHILYQRTDNLAGDFRSALVASEHEDGCFRVITREVLSLVREDNMEEALQFSSLRHLHKVQYTSCVYSEEEAVQRAISGGPRYCDSHGLASWAKTGVKHSLKTIMEELKAQCGKPVGAVPVNSPDKLHTGDHILYRDAIGFGGYRSALVTSEPGGGHLTVITKQSFMNPAREETLQFSSLPHLHKVQYKHSPCFYSGEQAVRRARSQPGPHHVDSHALVSWAKTGVKHSLSTIIEELKAQCGEPDIDGAVPVSLPEEEKLHTGDHILYQDTDSLDDCATVGPIAPIRGCTVVAERNFSLTQKAEVFNWPEYGITISAPENSIPDSIGSTQSVLLNVRVTLSGPFQLGASKLMSAVYWICPDIRCKFAKPLELTVEHCAHLTHPDDHTKLTFLRTKCNQKDLPYKFEENEGKFTAQSGTVALQSFSGVAVGSKAAESAPPPMKYVGRIVTQKMHDTEWKALYAVLKDLQSFRAFDREKKLAEQKLASDPFTTTYTALKYKENTISLDLPKNGVTDGNWKIRPLGGRPRLFIADGEFPECSLALEWIGSGTPSTTLHHTVNILGTADSDDYIVLHVNPRLQQAEHCRQQASTLSTQPQQSKHLAIEGLLPDLADVICGKSDPEVFAEHLAAKGFLSSQTKSNIMGTKGETPHSTVSKLLNAVVVTIKTANSPEESEKHFENFVTIIRKRLELNDLAQKLMKKCAELEDAASSAEASVPFTTAPAGIHQVTTAPKLNPLPATGSPQKRQVANAAADTTAVDNGPVPQAKPTKPEFKDAFKMLFALDKDWKSIGALLGMEKEKIRAIKDEEDSVSKDCLRVMLEEWLQSTAPPPSWQALADAVESIDSDTADKIQRDYIH